jgi:hypothetical protein
MSASNGVIKIGRKGLKKFAFGENDDAPVFEVDVVTTVREWGVINDSFRQNDDINDRRIPADLMPEYHKAAVKFVEGLCDKYKGELTIAEALDFIARLHEVYEEMAVFFLPKSRKEPDSPATSETEVRFSAEPS